MNAGCYGSETWDIVERVETIDRRGAVTLRPKAHFELGYRHCELKGRAIGRDEWFTGAFFRLPAGDSEASRARIKELLSRGIASQPLSLPNAGSVFRHRGTTRPGDRILRAQGLERGGARVSEKTRQFHRQPEGPGRLGHRMADRDGPRDGAAGRRRRPAPRSAHLRRPRMSAFGKVAVLMGAGPRSARSR